MSKPTRRRIVSAPRPVINLAILIGGGVGYLLQDAMNLNNEGAFVLTGVCCLVAVALTNFAWLAYEHTRKQDHHKG